MDELHQPTATLVDEYPGYTVQLVRTHLAMYQYLLLLRTGILIVIVMGS
jgi:hypothetical protein